MLTLWFCRSHPDTPWTAKLLAGLVLAYAFSPVDLIPDFIPVLGYLDDLIVVPLGIYLVLRLIPEHVLAGARAQADAWMQAEKARPVNYLGAVLVVVLWLGLIGLLVSIILEIWK